MRAYFWKVCEINSSGVILKCLSVHNWSHLKTNVFISLINPVSGIKSRNDRYINTYSASVEDRAMTVCNLETHKIGPPE